MLNVANMGVHVDWCALEGRTSASSALGLGRLCSNSYITFYSVLLVSSSIKLTNLTDYSHDKFLDNFAYRNRQSIGISSLNATTCSI